MVNKYKNLLITKKKDEIVIKINDYEREFGINERLWREATDDQRQQLVDYLVQLFYQVYTTRIIRNAYDPEDKDLGDDIMNNEFRDLLIHTLKKYGYIKDLRSTAIMYRMVRRLNGRLKPT